MVPFVYEGGVGAGGGGGGSDLSLNAVLFVPKWSGLSSPYLSSFGKLGVDFIFISRFHTIDIYNVIFIMGLITRKNL